MNQPTRVEIDDKQTVTLTWDDTVVTLTARELRAACVCADCRSEPGARRREAVLAGPLPVTVEGAKLRGAYAINLVFGPDGHATGIFTWDMLRSLAEPTG